jgi:hypothetical protein
MSTVPTPIRVMLGLAAAAAEEAKKLPETLPNVMTTVPMIAVSTAMQASLRLQQHIALLAAKGDDLLLQLRGTPEEAPPWATFDDPPIDAEQSDSRPQAAFDLIDYDHTGFTEGDDAARGRWDAVGVANDDPVDDAVEAPRPARAPAPGPTRAPAPARKRAPAPKKAAAKRTAQKPVRKAKSDEPHE